MKTRFAILASGEGTTAEAFIRACTAGHVDAEPVLIICNKENAGIFGRVQRLNEELGISVATQLINGRQYPPAADEAVQPGAQTLAEEAAILKALEENQIDIVLLAGYLRRIGPRLIAAYGWSPDSPSPFDTRMLNTHPGLLPETKGLWGIHVQEHVIEAGLPFAGQTLHAVAENYDEGPIIAEHQLPVMSGEDAESLFERVKALEKQSLPADIQAFIRARARYLQAI